jgi:hypothetical protein
MCYYVLNIGDDDDEEFTVEVHHGGYFVGHDSYEAYVDKRVNWFDHCEVV